MPHGRGHTIELDTGKKGNKISPIDFDTLQDDKSDKQKAAHKPIFMTLSMLVYFVLLSAGIFMNGGLEPITMNNNPMIGPSCAIIVRLGAKYVPSIRDGQHWRFFSSIFMHSGILHLLFVMLAQYRVGFPLEREFGMLRVAPVFLLSGVGGTLTSALFLPTRLSTGASGALYGLMGVMFSDLFQNWAHLESPFTEFLKLFFFAAISLALGLMPLVDNFAHVGGFFTGILAGLLFIPSIRFGLRKACLVLIALPLMFILFCLGFFLFYKAVGLTAWCQWCIYIDCIQQWCDREPCDIPDS